MKIVLRRLLGVSVLLLGSMGQEAMALEPQHQAAGSFGGTRLYAHDSVVISPYANMTAFAYSQTTTEVSTSVANAPRRDLQCRSVLNTSDQDYFVPWRTARNAPGLINEWTTFLAQATAGNLPDLRVSSCCYPRINPNIPCGVRYPLGKRTAGALPVLTMTATADTTAQSVEVPNYGADGDLSFDVVGFNRKESWLCQGGEWVQSSSQGGCFQNGKCNVYDPVANPSGVAGSSINALPSSNRAGLLCNGVDPVAVSGGKFPYPENNPAPPPYGTAGWRWKCPGQQGGTSEECRALYNGGPMNGVCGYANARTSATLPAVGNLCYVGTPSEPVVTYRTGTTTPSGWKWTCTGVNGGSTALNCYATLPPPATPPVASCGTYGSGSRSAGLLSFEVDSAGLPISTGLCGTGVAQNITGNGTTSSPWRWSCFNSVNNTTANCTNVYTKAGKCGSINGLAVPTAPNVSANMCSAGRWYNKATSGMSGSAVLWNAATEKWTWACLGHDQATGAVSNVSCSASKCLECAGTVTTAESLPIAGTYAGCDFSGADGRLSFMKTVTRLSDSADVRLDVRWQSDPVGHVTVPTDVATGYCSPCYKKMTGHSGATLLSPSCGLTVPRDVIVNMGPVTH